ncbi:ABC transporter permease [Turicibacter sanguinis]|nr:FtsX-like permease family protein [Turicibacter sanguinis]
MNMLLIAMATIVFIVGGIGIMNVLFLSIKERTKEIGILKALGSSKEEILLQFLFESVIISTFGGIMGVLLSYLLMPLMKYTNTPVSPSIEGQIIAIIFAMITGTLFGLYPAYKASQLKPIEALSYE